MALVIFFAQEQSTTRLENSPRHYGFYGENDNRVNATIPSTETFMQNAGKTYDYVIYDYAGHGFIRSGENDDATSGNKQARDKAIERLKEILAAI